MNAVAAIRASGRAAEHKLECVGESVWIGGDTTRVEQIVTNLLTNSLAYSPAGFDAHLTKPAPIEKLEELVTAARP